MQYTIIIHGTFKTVETTLRTRKSDDSDYSYNKYAVGKLQSESKGLYSTIKLELCLDGVVVDTTYGKVKKG